MEPLILCEAVFGPSGRWWLVVKSQEVVHRGSDAKSGLFPEEELNQLKTKWSCYPVGVRR